MLKQPSLVSSMGLLLALWSSSAHAGFSNYNSIVIGERAAGLGGAYTALSDDAAGAAFYNPASLARMRGSTISASAISYAKYDTRFGDEINLNAAPLRANQGSIIPIPNASGTVHSFHNFALGLSIVSPDFDSYAGEVRSTATSSSTVNLRDQSLWLGGSVALNVSEEDAFGITMYYTSRTYTRSVTDSYQSSGNQNITSEETYFSNNSLLYVLGYYRRLSERWGLGLSYRFPSIEINGKGSYFRSEVSSGGSAPAPVNMDNLSSNSNIADMASIGIAYESPKAMTISLDIRYHGTASYLTLQDDTYGERIEHKEIMNVLLGYEKYLDDWIVMRLGLYTNYSSHPRIPDNPTRRYPDHIDQWGWSANFGILTGAATKVTLGGYYTGGRGHATAEVDGQIERLDKSVQIFTFLVGTSFQY